MPATCGSTSAYTPISRMTPITFLPWAVAAVFAFGGLVFAAIA
jgi:hypothetical protein